jgi:hypothetical protein
MKIKPFFYTFAVTSVAAFIFIRTRKQLSLVYEKNSRRLVIDLLHKMKCCNMLTIEKIIVNVNGEILKSFYFKPGEKIYSGPIIIELPEVEAGDFIKVKLTSRCSRQFTKRGSLEL